MDCRDNLQTHEHLSDEWRPEWRWHVARCLHDKTAADSLRNLRYRVYRPMIPVQMRDRRNQSYTKWVSMFPTYLLVLPAGQSWELLRTANGILGGDHALLQCNGQFATISGGAREFLMIRETEKRFLENGKSAKFKAGDRIRVQKGQWMDFFAVVDRLDDKSRICCFVDMLGTQRRALIPSKFVIPA